MPASRYRSTGKITVSGQERFLLLAGGPRVLGEGGGGLHGGAAGAYIDFMKNSFSIVSMILMAVVMVIVLLLVARAWTSVAPTAMQIATPSNSGLGQDEEGEDGEDAQRLPTLNDMRENTAEHAEQLEEARQQIDQ